MKYLKIFNLKYIVLCFLFFRKSLTIFIAVFQTQLRLGRMFLIEKVSGPLVQIFTKFNCSSVWAKAKISPASI